VLTLASSVARALRRLPERRFLTSYKSDMRKDGNNNGGEAAASSKGGLGEDGTKSGMAAARHLKHFFATYRPLLSRWEPVVSYC
jgi:hypothetical protein